ncbi:MAG TPA: class I SAM-dependent methyltransferase [Spirochaetota bacterium]|nr:class I SAM-dependent methyltransferase [Spirochaetota bacterium]HPC39445.1 class I SAM-dependent methyltransferase [Spirochaetota bacterium]HPL15891.1 class I SAM-dependent methyltransferase [Spirochaetota bacterium]HQF06782.1 class I SAM-dependent methyltransferase [Spirochaetota bacterium]HQH95599.1 class I SAM-dependent methyltransferase [Spirochaetota bacterium]
MADSTPHCPVCSSPSPRRIRDNLYLCNPCGITFNTAYAVKSYSDTYFLDEYRNQYGKTYIEDYDTIYSLSSGRLKTIFSYLPKKTARSDLSILDVGSAAGFFLSCARDMGAGSVTGIEISDYASAYCIEHFNIPVMRSPFAQVTLPTSYSIITAWYFIEHTDDPVSVMKKIHRSLYPGGVFAFSVPSIFGPLFVFDRDSWVRTHPTDHYMDFSPRGIRKILTGIGFRKIHVRAAGIHPERIVDPHSVFFRPFALLYGSVSRLISFSDTMEVYAVK